MRIGHGIGIPFNRGRPWTVENAIAGMTLFEHWKKDTGVTIDTAPDPDEVDMWTGQKGNIELILFNEPEWDDANKLVKCNASGSQGFQWTASHVDAAFNSTNFLLAVRGARDMAIGNGASPQFVVNNALLVYNDSGNLNIGSASAERTEVTWYDGTNINHRRNGSATISPTAATQMSAIASGFFATGYGGSWENADFKEILLYRGSGAPTVSEIQRLERYLDAL